MAGSPFKWILGICLTVTVQSLPGAATVTPQRFASFAGPVCLNDDGRLEIFGIGPNDSVWNCWQSAAGGGLHPWNDLVAPDAKAGLAAARNSNGSLEVFFTRGDRAVWHGRQTGTAHIWSAWQSMGGTGITGLQAATFNDGSLQVFGVGTNGTLQANWQLAPAGEWNGWTDLGGPRLQPGFVIGHNDDGSIEVFAVGVDTHVWRKRQLGKDAWTEWSDLGGPGVNPRLAVARNTEGCIELFGLSGAKVWRNAQSIPGGEQWEGWTDLGGPSIHPGFVAAANADGRVELFGVGGNGDVWHLWQNFDLTWNEWKDMGGPGSDPQLAAGNNADGRLQIFAVGQNADVWANWQIGPGRVWNGWTDTGGHGVRLYNGQRIRRPPQYASSVWQMADGLPFNAVNAVLQTRDGYLWAGTAKGLARFDGQRFVKMEAVRANFPPGSVRALAEDQASRLWAGLSEGGVFCLDGPGLQSFDIRGVKTIYPARDGTVWAGSAGGLVSIQDGKERTYSRKDGLLDNRVQALAEDAEGTLWIGTPAGLNTFRNGTLGASYTNLNERPDRYGVQNVSVTALCGDGTGGMWIGTVNGIVHRRSGDFRDHFRTDNFGLNDNSINALFLDRKGVLWIGTDAGLNCWAEGNACISVFDSDGSALGRINSVCEDREGDVWAGGRDGLRRLRPRVFTTYGRQAGFVHNNIMSVLQDREDAIWAGVWGGGLCRFKDGLMSTWPTGPVLRTDLILSLCEDRDGSMWFGADRGFGLYNLNQRTVTRYGGRKGLIDGAVRVIYQDSRSNLWIGSGQELTLMHRGQFVRYTKRDGLAGDVVQAILEDHRGVLWFGTSTGLSRRVGGKFVNYTTHDGLSSDNVTALYEDSERNLWIGTVGGGLVRFRDGTFRAYRMAQGLASDDVLEILEDNRGCLWMSCLNGVFRVEKRSFVEFDSGAIRAIPCASYGKTDGMVCAECNGLAKPAGWKDRNGYLWFPTSKGLVMGDPNTPLNTTPPPVVIEEVYSDKHKEGLTPPGDGQTPLRVPPGRGELEIHYTALSLQEPEQNRFKYKLEGFDREWVDAGTRRVAYYDNLAPGRYEFRVMACNNDGIWNERGAALTLALAPHFWQTAWFYAGVGVAAIGALAGLVRQFTTRKLRRELAMLEQRHAVEQERSRIARDMHDDLGARLSEVLLLTEMTRANGARPEELRALTGKISSAARDLVDNLDALVWAVNPRNDSLDRFADYVGENAGLYLEASGVRCVFELPPKLPALPLSSEVRHNLFLLIREALHNIVKHAGASEARLSLRLDSGQMMLVIADNGRGFSGNGHSHFGNGLINMEDRMKKIGATFRLESQAGTGTRITVTIPLPRADEAGPANPTRAN